MNALRLINPCDQVCNNTDTEGSFECSCTDCFQLQDSALTCEDECYFWEWFEDSSPLSEDNQYLFHF